MIIKLKDSDTLINFNNITKCYIGGYSKNVIIFRGSGFFQVDSIFYKNYGLAKKGFEEIENAIVNQRPYIEI
jgi:hypothetical protein